MEHPEPEYSYVIDSPRYRVARTTFLVICAALMVALVCLLFNVYRLKGKVSALESEIARSHGVVASEVTKVRELSSFMADTNRHTIKSLREELDTAKQQATASAGQARADAQNTVQRLARELQAEEQKQREQHEEVKKEIASAKQVASTADARLTDVKNEVGTVKGEVVKTQDKLTRVFSDLRQAIGDMGVLSGRIATNQQELEVLKALGDRNYTEFRIPKSKDAQLVNGVRLTLKKADPGARKFTLEVATDDQKVQKRDKNINEPVQFYVGEKRQPYELVVNAVSKNEIVGYMATPKLDVDRD